MLAAYPSALNLDKKTIASRVQRALIESGVREEVNWSAERVIILAGRERTLVAVFGDLPAARRDPARLLRFVSYVNRVAASPNRNLDQPRSNYQTQQLHSPPDAAALRAGAPAALLADADGFAVTLAAPNWLMSGASQHGGTGGPGAWPIAASVPPATTSRSAVAPWEFTLPFDLGKDDAKAAATTPVTVAILDTAPPLESLRAAHTRLVESTQPPHPLLADLLGGVGAFDTGVGARLQVSYADVPMLAQADADLAAHPYVMSDHGLFIAGIIGTVAPAAKLHLIEVLNPYGVGTLESIARGFEQVLAIRTNLPADAPLVVNCSLVLNLPRDPAHLAAQQKLVPDLQSLSFAEAQQMSRMLEAICALVGAPADESAPPSTIIIAAAGNDSAADQRIPARFPAAYASVTGVAALTRADLPTVYSNLADQPDVMGFAVFGGETAPASDPALPPMADANGGMLGVYIGPIDGQPYNPSGWARWAGTSFAAPLISGALARLVGAAGIGTLPAADAALRGVDARVNIGEVLHISQG